MVNGSIVLRFYVMVAATNASVSREDEVLSFDCVFEPTSSIVSDSLGHGPRLFIT